MAITKIELDGHTLFDVSCDTISEEDVKASKTFHKCDGTIGTGTFTGISISFEPSPQAQSATPPTGFYYNEVTVDEIPAEYYDTSDANITAADVASGKIAYGANGQIVGTASAGKNIQYYNNYASVKATSYTSTTVKLTCNKTGTYTVSWLGFRQSNSGTNGSELFVNGSLIGSAYTSFTDTYVQRCVATNISITAGQTVEIRARSRSTSYAMIVGNLIIEEN